MSLLVTQVTLVCDKCGDFESVGYEEPVTSPEEVANIVLPPFWCREYGNTYKEHKIYCLRCSDNE